MVGVVARFEFLPGNEGEVGEFFAAGKAIVEGQPASTGWFAIRVDATNYMAFACFASEADREALLAAGGPALSRQAKHLFAGPPSFERVDVVAARLPAAG